MAYLDTILSAAMQGPSEDDKNTLRRLAGIAGSSNYGMAPADAAPAMQTPMAGYMGARIPLSTINEPPPQPTEQPLPVRNMPERAYPPAEGIGQDPRFEVPPPTDLVKRRNAILDAEAAMNYPGAHDISKTRRILGDVAGGLTGILGVNPMAGIRMSEAIKTEPFRRSLAELERKKGTLEPQIEEEQKRTKEYADIYKTERTAELGAGRLGVSEGTLAERARADRVREQQALENEYDKKAHQAVLENLAVGKLQLTGTLAEKKAQLDRELTAERIKARHEDVETTGRYNVEASQGRVAAQKAPSPEEETAAANVAELVGQTDDPIKKEGLVSTLTPGGRTALAAKNKGAIDYTKIAPGLKPKFTAAKTALDLISQIRDEASKTKEALGPVLGRIAQGKAAIGTGGAAPSALQTKIARLVATDAASMSSGRTPFQLLKWMQANEAKITSNPEQFFAQLKAMEEGDKATYRQIANSEYIPPVTGPDLKIRVLGPAPKE